MWLFIGIAMAFVYIFLTNKKKMKKKTTPKKQTAENPGERRPIVPYRWSSESSEEQERESGMALLSAEKQQEAIAAPNASEVDPDVIEDITPVAEASNDASHGLSEAPKAVERANETAEESVVTPAGLSMIRSFWEAGRELQRLSGKELQSFSTFEGGTRRYPYCHSALTDKPTARKWVDELQARLSEDLVAFIGTTQWEDDEARQDAEVVIGKSETPFDILRLAQTDAASYDLSTEDLITKLRDFDKRYGIRIFAAESNSVGFELLTVPEDLPTFAAELHAFCPNAEGAGNPEQLASHLQATRDIELKWFY